MYNVTASSGLLTAWIVHCVHVQWAAAAAAAAAASTGAERQSSTATATLAWVTVSRLTSWYHRLVVIRCLCRLIVDSFRSLTWSDWFHDTSADFSTFLWVKQGCNFYSVIENSWSSEAPVWDTRDVERMMFPSPSRLRDRLEERRKLSPPVRGWAPVGNVFHGIWGLENRSDEIYFQ